MAKISDFTTLTGAGVDTAADVIPIVDGSETGTARNKKITVAELLALATPGDEAIDDRVAALLAAGTNITLTYNDAGNVLTIDAAATSGGITDFNESVDDRVAALIVAGSGITKTYDDAAGTLTLTATGTSGMLVATNNLSDVADAPTARGNLAAAAASQTGEQISGFIASPSNKSYTIALKMAHAGTITETTTISASGTCTATFKVNSTALGGTANSVSSVEQSQAHSTTNTFAAGDDIVLTVSANASCADMSFTIKYTRTLA